MVRPMTDEEYKKWKSQKEKKVMENKKISGALFDFIGYLTTLDEPITFSSKHEVPIALDCLKKWAEKRGLDLDGADVQNWNVE